MDLQQVNLEIHQLREQMTLTLDNPPSVKLQIKKINLIQKQLRAIKREINLAIQEIHQQATQTAPDSIISVGLDLFGKRRLAGQLRQTTRRTIQFNKITQRQPYMDVKNHIDKIILEGDKLKLKGQQYLGVAQS